MKPFESPLGPQIEAFLKLKRALGRRYYSAEYEMRSFDRFVAGRDDPVDTVTRALVLAWLNARPHLKPVTLRSRGGILRQFCLYMVRLAPHTYVPDRTLFPVRGPTLKAYVNSEADIRMFLRAAQSLPQLRWSLQPQTVHTMLLTLYSTGLRAGEVSRLLVGDVDLEARTLLVRDTKFFKTRCVPFSASLVDALQDYLKARTALANANRQAPFFINRCRRAYAPNQLSHRFRRLRMTLGIEARPGARGPRLHDVRRTFAVHRLLRWYRQGVDVQAKLPLLATYMGHSDVLATHVYLDATVELLQEASGRFEDRCGSLITAVPEASDDPQ